MGSMVGMLRDEIRQLIADIRPFDPLEQKHIQFATEWIDFGAPLFRTQKPATPETHLVAYFLVVSPNKERILLVEHKAAGLWLPSGGHVEPDEHPLDTVKREVKEELTFEADFIQQAPLFLTVTSTVGSVTRHTDVSLWFLLKADPSDPIQFDSSEFYQVKWFLPEDIPYQQAEPHLNRFLSKMRSSRPL